MVAVVLSNSRSVVELVVEPAEILVGHAFQAHHVVPPWLLCLSESNIFRDAIRMWGTALL
jgi:hypothetical protein